MEDMDAPLQLGNFCTTVKRELREAQVAPAVTPAVKSVNSIAIYNILFSKEVN